MMNRLAAIMTISLLTWDNVVSASEQSMDCIAHSNNIPYEEHHRRIAEMERSYDAMVKMYEQERDGMKKEIKTLKEDVSRHQVQRALDVEEHKQIVHDIRREKDALNWNLKSERHKHSTNWQQQQRTLLRTTRENSKRFEKELHGTAAQLKEKDHYLYKLENRLEREALLNQVQLKGKDVWNDMLVCLVERLTSENNKLKWQNNNQKTQLEDQRTQLGDYEHVIQSWMDQERAKEANKVTTGTQTSSLSSQLESVDEDRSKSL